MEYCNSALGSEVLTNKLICLSQPLILSPLILSLNLTDRDFYFQPFPACFPIADLPFVEEDLPLADGWLPDFLELDCFLF